MDTTVRRGAARLGTWFALALALVLVLGAVLVGGARAGATATRSTVHLQPGAPAAGYLALRPSPLATWCAADLLAAAPVVGAAGLAGGSGGWDVTADGGVFACGAAGYYGSVPGLGLHPAAPVVGMAATSDGRGYWLVADDGGVFTFGDARFVGAAASLRLDAPVVALVADGTDDGYWLVAADGGVFAYGAAAFAGSMAGRGLTAPVVGAASPGGRGYWLVAADGGVFAFGGAAFHGSAADAALAAPASAITPAPDGLGYWVVARDGGVFADGSAGFDPQAGPDAGTPVGVTPVNPVIALLPDTGDSTYSLLAAFPGVAPGVPGRSGYDLARDEFALDPTTDDGAAVLLDLAQAQQYLLLDGTTAGADPAAVASTVQALDVLWQFIFELHNREGGVSRADATTAVSQIASFLGLPAGPYLAYVSLS